VNPASANPIAWKSEIFCRCLFISIPIYSNRFLSQLNCKQVMCIPQRPLGEEVDYYQ
jgi:hypothetical protein